MNEDMPALLRRAKNGDRDAAQRLVEENTGLIWSVTRRFFGRGAEPDDLYQLGCVGFLKAVEGFDESFGTRFSTYAVPKISGEIRRFLRDDGAIKVSRSIKEQAALSAEEIAFAETATGPADSIQRESGEDGFTLELVLGDYGAEERLVEHVALHAALEHLPQRERQVIALRFFHGLTQQRCADVLHVSQVQISRMERRALERLREYLRET